MTAAKWLAWLAVITPALLQHRDKADQH
eukprot:COSAG01_NODE_24663_length_771_cov_1.226190_2_plen_27_part_01